MDSVISANSSQIKAKKSFLDWLRIVFLWVPFAEKPGFLALLMVISRITIYGLILNVLLVLAGFKFDLVGRILGWTIWVGMEELNRYAFLRKAKNIVRAATFFIIAIVTVETLVNLKLYTGFVPYVMVRAPSVVVHILATSLMAWSITRPKLRLPIFILILAAHTAFDTWASYHLSV